MIDSYGRNINYLRISLTSFCNLACTYCMPNKLCSMQHQVLQKEELVKLIKAFSNIGIKKVRLTGGEPLLYPHLNYIIREIKKLKNIEEVTMTTNGILLEEKAKELKKSGLDRVNISLDTLDATKYKGITRKGDIKKVFEGIKKANLVGLNPIRINVVLMKGFNDNEAKDFIQWTKREAVDIRFIEIMPIGDNQEFIDKYYMPVKDILDSQNLIEIPSNKESVARYYKAKGAKGRIGVIPAMSQHFCNRCNRIRINALGELKFCLLNEAKVDLKPAIREEVNLEDYLNKIIKLKPKEHNGRKYDGNMFQIGG